jgi:hypothetical protein
MNRKLCWIIPLVVALLVTGCGNDPKKDELKPPSVYRNPQVRITHAPTVVVADVATVAVEAEASALPTDPVIYFNPTEEDPEAIDMAMMDQIEALLSKIGNELDRIDTEP